MPNQLDGTVKEMRSKALIELNDINEHAFTEKFIGRVMDVLIEKKLKISQISTKDIQGTILKL